MGEVPIARQSDRPDDTIDDVSRDDFFVCLQRGRQLRGDYHDQSHTALHGQGGVETAGHIQIVLRDQRRVFPVRRADVFDEVRLVDLRRIHGERPRVTPLLTYP